MGDELTNIAADHETDIANASLLRPKRCVGPTAFGDRSD
jgi:hypothetical protein